MNTNILLSDFLESSIIIDPKKAKNIFNTIKKNKCKCFVCSKNAIISTGKDSGQLVFFGTTDKENKGVLFCNDCKKYEIYNGSCYICYTKFSREEKSIVNVTVTRPIDPIQISFMVCSMPCYLKNRYYLSLKASNSVNSGRCNFCNNSSSVLKTCKNCKISRYCNKDCQKSNWKEHKEFCLMTNNMSKI